MILAAGLGTRLRPLTHVRPKVLTPVHGVRVLDFWIQRLHACGCEGVVVNAFHLGDRLVRAVMETSCPMPVEVRLEDLLLGTGGGVRNVLDFFDEGPVTIINGDVICDVDLHRLRSSHDREGNRATLLMHDFPVFNNVAVSAGGAVHGFARLAQAVVRDLQGFRLEAFTGIHVVECELLRRIPPGQFHDILTLYNELIEEGSPPKAFHQEGLYWREMGSMDAYRSLTVELSRKPRGFLPPLVSGEEIVIHPEAQISDDVVLKGCVSVGKGCRIGRKVQLEDTILWERVQIAEGSRLRGCIVADDQKVAGFHVDKVIAEASP